MAWTALRPFVLPRAIELLRREIERPRSHREWLDFTHGFHQQLFAPRRLRKRFAIAPSQVSAEIVAWLEMVADLKPRCVMEIGTSTGGVLFLLARAAAPDAMLIGLDLPRATDAVGHGGVAPWKERYFRGFAGSRQSIELVLGDSHAATTRSHVERLLGGRELDVLFIDGDHSYEGVRQDFHDYAPLVRPGGLIGFHDIVADVRTRTGADTKNDAGEVHRFWAELKRDHDVIELVENADQDGFGIGAIHQRGSPSRARAPINA
jgi:predicted O-methyltransferase YrrM